MLDDRKKWIAYNYSGKGPYLVLIVDMQWWDENRDQIDEWFDRNCPICKPEPFDTIVTFQNQSQYTMWKMCWSSI